MLLARALTDQGQQIESLLTSRQTQIVTVLLDNSDYFTHTFPPRVVAGVQYGLNTGLVGFGLDNSRGSMDNITVQILPRVLILDRSEDFDDGAADLVALPDDGAWNILTGRYAGQVAGDEQTTARVDLGQSLGFDAYLELETWLGNRCVQFVDLAGFGRPLPQDYRRCRG